MAVPNLSEITATTIRNRSKKLADTTVRNHPLLKKLSERGRVKPASGGENIMQELFFDNNNSAGWYSGYETLNISPNDVISAAEFDWKQASVAVSISGLDELKNSGKEKMIDLIEARVENAEIGIKNLVHEGTYADGTGSSGKELGGLQLLVPDDPTTGTAGSINRANYTFWRSVKYDASSDGGAAASSANIQKYMNAVFYQLCRNSDKPDCIIADDNYYGFYEESLQAIQRITSEKKGEAGFESLKYKGADVYLGGGYAGVGGTGCPANHMYFLNTNYLFLRPHRDRNFVPLKPDRFATNQDAMVQLIGWAGNMTASLLGLQGVLIA